MQEKRLKEPLKSYLEQTNCQQKGQSPGLDLRIQDLYDLR